MTQQELMEIIKSVVGAEVKELIEEQRAIRRDYSALLAMKAQEKPKVDKSILVGRMLRALAAGKGDKEKAAWFVKKLYGEDDPVYKAFTVEGDAEDPSGMYLVPEEYSSDIIELLTDKAVVRKAGAVVLPMETGTLNIPMLTSGAVAYYVGESSNVTASLPATGQLKLSWKKLAALVPVSNDLLRFSSPKADAIVRDSLVNSLALKEDLAFIRGSGTDNTPKGMRYWVDTDNVITMSTSGGSVTAATVLNDLLKAIYKLRNANSPFNKPGWIFNPRVEYYLKGLRDSTSGALLFHEEMSRGTLLGFPYYTTTQIPVNLGTGADETEVYFVDFGEMIIAESSQLLINVSDAASYIDPDSSELVSAFSRDETVMRALARHDFGARHPESIAIITACTWGSGLSS